MAAIPSKANLTGSGVKQAGFRTALDTLHDYLTGLLGSDGTSVTARSELGLGSAATRNVGTGAADLTDNARVNSLITGLLPSGTRMIFYQASAPNGWSQVTTVNDRVLRIVSGQGGASGGSWEIVGLSTRGQRAAIGNLPIHDHPYKFRLVEGNSANAYNAGNGWAFVMTTTGDPNSFFELDYNSPILKPAKAGSELLPSVQVDSSSTWRPKYIDVIACERD